LKKTSQTFGACRTYRPGRAVRDEGRQHWTPNMGKINKDYFLKYIAGDL
jgi:hypothetical protein